MIGIGLDEYDMYDEPNDEPADVKCKRCGKSGLFWQKMYVNGEEKPVLFEIGSRYGTRRHECAQQADRRGYFDNA